MFVSFYEMIRSKKINEVICIQHQNYDNALEKVQKSMDATRQKYVKDLTGIGIYEL